MNFFGIHGLNNECLLILENLRLRGYSLYMPIFELLYLHGFRANELQYYKDWQLQPDNTVIMPTSKRGNARVIELETLPPLIQESITTGEKLFYLTKYETLNYYFERVSPHLYEIGNKNLTTHIFRHNRIKQMYNQGYTVEAIQQAFGLQRTSTVNNYINSQISYRLRPY